VLGERAEDALEGDCVELAPVSLQGDDERGVLLSWHAGPVRGAPPGSFYAGVFSATPAAARSASALSVRSQVKSRSSRPKWP
jgi:hypothetical protein